MQRVPSRGQHSSDDRGWRSLRHRNANGYSEVAVEDFVVGVGRNALAPGEFLLGLKLAMPNAETKDAYLRFTPRTEMDIAVAGVGVSLTVVGGQCTNARVAIGAVAPTAMLVPEAHKPLWAQT